MEPQTPWRWLESTRALQRDAFHRDPKLIQDNPGEVGKSVLENFTPIIVEMVELLNEVKWKYWSHEEPWVRRDRVIAEAVDVMHFLGNILVAVGATDDELEEAYRAKQQENRDRQLRKYVSQQAEEKP